MMRSLQAVKRPTVVSLYKAFAFCMNAVLVNSLGTPGMIHVTFYA